MCAQYLCLGVRVPGVSCAALHNASEAQASCSPPTAVAWGHPDYSTHTHTHTGGAKYEMMGVNRVKKKRFNFAARTVQTFKRDILVWFRTCQF